MMVTIAVLVLLAAFLAFVASRSSMFRLARSTEIDAPPDRIYPYFADFHNWAAWSPFEKYDPAMTRTYSGAPSGRGAVYEWSGNSRAGQGRMEILDVAPPTRVTTALHFIKPFPAQNMTEFTLEPSGNATRVSWAMSGNKNFMMKLFHVFVNMEKMVGKDFDEGLANLKRVAEGQPVAR